MTSVPFNSFEPHHWQQVAQQSTLLQPVMAGMHMHKAMDAHTARRLPPVTNVHMNKLAEGQTDVKSEIVI